ncbi:hypothetical protein BPAE_0232g00140 [Botrytis paeoniae]|uniref:Uncharacterized protein n=1 Tax=Botrytis paeoniae TaxID=278948 RepID=A0A4Z1FEM6_9HELO|nr:hypothetical protein BPAE_0232g00140 [Botrytis paeoniae]
MRKKRLRRLNVDLERNGRQIVERNWAAAVSQDITRAVGKMFWKNVLNCSPGKVSPLSTSDIKDEIAYHHQATTKQKTFIRDNVVYVPEFLQNCRFVAEKPHIKELRGLSEERQWRGLGLWILAAKRKHLGIALPMDLEMKKEMKCWNGVLDSTGYFVECEQEALKEKFEERSLVLRTK